MPPLLEPTPNLRGSTHLDELAEDHLGQLLHFLEQDPRPDPVSTPPKIEYWVRSGSGAPEPIHVPESGEHGTPHTTQIKDHNQYLEGSDEFDSRSPLNQSVVRAWQAARHTLHSWSDFLTRSISPESQVPAEPQPQPKAKEESQPPESQEAKRPSTRDELLTWSYWKQLWFDWTTPKHRTTLLLALTACLLLAGLGIALKSSTQAKATFKPQAALQVLADRMELLEERWHDRLQKSLKVRVSRRTWRRKTRQWLRHIGRDREERRFLRKLQNKLLVQMTKPQSLEANAENWRDMFTSRLGLLDLDEERLYSKLQRLSRHKRRRHRTKHTRNLLRQIKQIREERKFLHFLQKKLLGTTSKAA
ncbi:MAG: hypothetical protein EP343_21755 [Deltaproteobacteria bacterium]|nr:MAG: hypothetical protein EP343_21755 [Deltaproteobacteria bacterium]